MDFAVVTAGTTCNSCSVCCFSGRVDHFPPLCHLHFHIAEVALLRSCKTETANFVSVGARFRLVLLLNYQEVMCRALLVRERASSPYRHALLALGGWK